MALTTWIIFLLLIPYVITGYIICTFVRDRVACFSQNYYPYWLGQNVTLPESAKIFEERFCAGDYHDVRCLVGTMWTGFAMLTFRLLPGKRTKVIKYVHVAMHGVTLAIFGYDFYKLYTIEHSITHSYFNFHGLSGKVVIGLLYFQFLLAGFVYIYLFENCTLRCVFAPIHDIFGIWIYICLVACCLAGHYRARADYGPDIHPKTIVYTCGCFSIIVVIVVSPLFEWDMVGAF